MLKIKEGPAGIVQKFGQESLTKDAIVAVLPYTTDNKFLFGVVSSKTIQKNGSLDTIGGTLNRDEKKVNTIDDVKRYMIMEMREEIGLNFDENNLFLHSLNYFHSDGRYRFIYLCRLPEDSSYYEGISVNEELSKIRLMSKDELIHYSGPSTNRIPFCQKNIEEILKDFSEFELERV
jgi:8-oxo-dGTP pyrophosphatase MutT (NUDIX family)